MFICLSADTVMSFCISEIYIYICKYYCLRFNFPAWICCLSGCTRCEVSYPAESRTGFDLTYGFNANNCPCRHWRQCVYCYRVCKWIIHPISTYFVLQTEKWYNSALQFTRTTRRDVMSCTATIKDFSMKRPRKFCRHALDEFQNESGTKLSPELESDL